MMELYRTNMSGSLFQILWKFNFVIKLLYAFWRTKIFWNQEQRKLNLNKFYFLFYIFWIHQKCFPISMWNIKNSLLFHLNQGALVPCISFCLQFWAKRQGNPTFDFWVIYFAAFAIEGSGENSRLRLSKNSKSRVLDPERRDQGILFPRELVPSGKI